jgi:RimJ/RimL family protein N-acetyltransferase
VAALLFSEETMLDIQTQLFEGQDIRFGPIDHEAHPEIESKWTHDAEFMRLWELNPVRPLPPALMKKEYESIEKKMEDDHNIYYFTIRAREDDHLIGKAIIQWIDWANGNGWLRLGLGAAADRQRGLGGQALRMLLHFAFAELNLYRVSAIVPEYNEAAIHLLHKFGFVEEVRRRQAVDRDGRRWDLLTFGLLRSEWESQAQVQK